MPLDEQRRRMVSGQMYNDLAPELIRARERALYWHRRHEGSAQHAWLRGLVAKAMRSSEAGTRE